MSVSTTITAFRYDDTTAVEQTTPLGTTVAQELVLDNLVATVALPESHEIQFKPEAIGERLSRYGLSDNTAAVEAIVREAVFSWSPDLTPADPANPLDVRGGTDSRISVSWTDGVDASSVLSPLAGRIEAARVFFS